MLVNVGLAQKVAHALWKPEVSDNREMTRTNQSAPSNLTLAMTGASGSVYAVEMLRALVADTRVTKINLVVTDNALRVLAEEMEIGGRTELVERMLGARSEKVQQHVDANIGANI